jgi:uncharacterized protein (TIGR02231 family)
LAISPFIDPPRPPNNFLLLAQCAALHNPLVLAIYSAFLGLLISNTPIQRIRCLQPKIPMRPETLDNGGDEPLYGARESSLSKTMNTIRLLSVTALGLPALALATPVDSRISAATVYSDRAVVTRIAELDLIPGEKILVFERLPSNLVDQSLQVSGHGTASATILDVNTETTYVDSAPNPRVKDLEDQILDLNKQSRTLDDRTGVLNEERDFVRRMMQSATKSYPVAGDGSHGGETGGRPTLEDWQKLYTYSEEALGKIADELGVLEDKRKDLASKKATINQQLGALRSAEGKSIKNVKVRVAVATAGHLEFALKYAVTGATWVSSYDARLHADDRMVELAYYGLVRNGTGEDWDDIALTLSTSRPGLGGSAPELLPWVVDVRRSEESMFMEREGSRARIEMKNVGPAVDAATRQFQAGTEAPTPNASADLGIYDSSAQVQTNATSATFKIPSSASVPSNNSIQRVSIASARLASELEYDSTPKMTEVAYLNAEVSNTTDYPFLAGSMNTFLDETFVATSRLKTVMPGEKFELHLGADEGIAVKRRLVSRFAENTGLTNTGSRITYEYLITITNNKKTSERVAFREPLPLSRQEKIVVRLIMPEEESVGTKALPKEVSREEDGNLVWRLDLKPGEKREVPLKFSVSFPSDISVTGLE